MSLIIALAGAVLICAPEAHADTYSFSVHDPSAMLGRERFNDYSFTINTSTTPAFSGQGGDVLYIVQDTGTGTYGEYTVSDLVTFFTEGHGGGFQNDFSLTLEPSTQLFAGSGNNVTFRDSATPYAFDNGTTIKITNLSVPTAVSAAPEPGTWALLLGGVGVIGAMMRVAQARRREDELKSIATA